MKLKKIFFIIEIIFISQVMIFSESISSKNNGTKAVERFAIYVGSNRGGTDRKTLRYAGSDAQRIASTMIDIGGIKSENSHILVEPNKKEIERLFDELSVEMKNISSNAKRIEFIFYYSGHSDEEALLLGNERYSYSDLKDSISKVPSDVHVVMLDSCYSGNFIRAKGGQRQKSFLVDDSSVVQGHAYLSSSSESESSQESDVIGSSFFTNSLVTGLRGAADSSGDNKISLNELYHYAFNDTLYNTEESAAGPQHPSFNITLVGSGDLVLTDISEAEAALVLAKENEGRFFIRDASGLLISEITKTSGNQITLALPSGKYSVTVVTSDKTLQAEITLSEKFPVILKQSEMTVLTRQKNTLRGDEIEENNYTEEELEKQKRTKSISFSFPAREIEEQYFNGLNVTFISCEAHDVNGCLIAGISNKANNVNGLQVAGVFNIANDLPGLQIAGVFNKANNVDGLQIAGVFNKAETVTGLQLAGVINIADVVEGVQFGLINIAKENKGLAFGLVNIIQNGVCELSPYIDKDKNITFQFQNGSRYLFTTGMVGTNLNLAFNYWYLGYGIGTRIVIFPKVTFDIEAIHKQVFSSDFGYPYTNFLPTFRLSMNSHIGKHLILFLSWNVEANIEGVNDNVFTEWSHSGKFTSLNLFDENINLYGGFLIGIKVSFGASEYNRR